MNIIPFPDKQYRIIYADPPWSFSSKELQKYQGTRFTSIDKHYNVQKDSWIKDLPVKTIALPDSALFLWTTDAHLPIAIDVITSWGYKYITVAFVWNKQTSTGKDACTLGSWTIKSCELCLFGTRGKMLQYKKSNNIRQLIKAPRNKHSEKPDIVRQSIVSLFGDEPRIELFARTYPIGWDVWGNQVNNYNTQDEISDAI